MWNEFFPISIPITATAVCAVAGMVCSLSGRPLPASIAGGAGARPDHPIKRLRMAPVTDRTSCYMAIPERSLDPNPADGAGLVAHAQALLRFIVGLGWW